MTAVVFSMSWTDQGTSIRMDLVSMAVALALHAPLCFVKFDFKRRIVDRPHMRLVSVDLLEQVAPALPPAPVVKEDSGFLAKLKALMKKKPAPPPKPKKVLEPKKIEVKPNEIKLDPKLNMKADQAKLKSKAGFETKVDPDLVKAKQLEMKNVGGPAAAPLSEKRLGLAETQPKLKSSRGNFQIAQKESLAGIGGDSGPAVADAAAPTIAIQTGKKGTTEKFSAPQKSSKGRFGGKQVASLTGEEEKKLGLRDYIIARDAAPAEIGSKPGAGGAGDLAAGLATKKDAGSFDAQGTAGFRSQPGGNTGALKQPKTVPAIKSKPKKKKKKSLFVITGPLKDRKIVRKVIPEYPAWAQTEGIEAAVILEFVVTPEGTVKEPIVVRRTSGYPKLDESSIKALSQWKFAPLPDDPNRQEVGIITFNYTLD